MKELLHEIDELQKEINKHRPLDAYTLKEIKEYYRIGLVYSSNALEGNTLTESETNIVLNEGITVAGKPLKHHLEAVGLSDAFNFLYKDAHAKAFSEDLSAGTLVQEGDIKKFHWLFYIKIDPEQAGKYRDIKVYIRGSEYPLPLPEEVPGLMHEWLEKTKEQRKNLHPVVFAALAHKDFVFIHPFVDGNGRVARLIMNLVLLQEGYNIAIIPPILRSEYIRYLEKAHTDDTGFITFIAKCVKETQKDYLRLFR